MKCAARTCAATFIAYFLIAAENKKTLKKVKKGVDTYLYLW